MELCRSHKLASTYLPDWRSAAYVTTLPQIIRESFVITISAYNWVPDFAKGLVRDLRVRWALEEAGLPYKVELINHREKNSESYRARQPFGQVPVYQEGDLTLFESGSIVLHIAGKTEVLLPREDPARARAVMWIFAALNSVEPSFEGLAQCRVFSAGEPWTKEALPVFERQVKKRLTDIEQYLTGREWLEDRFTAGDLMMTTVLRRLSQNPLIGEHPTLRDYVARAEARPAFARAFQAHMADFTGAPPPGFA